MREYNKTGEKNPFFLNDHLANLKDFLRITKRRDVCFRQKRAPRKQAPSQGLKENGEYHEHFD
jgi:hypothetical protein